MANAVNTPPGSPTQERSILIGRDLERLSAAVVNACNARDFSFSSSDEAREVRAHIAPDFRSQVETRPDAADNPMTWEGQVDAWRERTEEFPDVWFEVKNVQSQVNVGKGVATTYLEMEVTGIANLKLLAMNEMHWLCTDGQWFCYHVIGMRGSPGNSGYG